MTSVGSVSRIRRVSRRIASRPGSGSSSGHTTDRLLSLGQRVAPGLPVRELDLQPRRVRQALQDGVTLGRGGSDITAVALAGALGASVCEILTDVDGVLTAGPGDGYAIRGVAYEPEVGTLGGRSMVTAG